MSFSERMYQNRTQIIIIAVVLFLVELQIFAVSVSRSGQKHTLQVVNDNGTVIYETNGKDLTEFKKYYFEETFGPFENYQKKLVTQTVPFPFRAWFTAAIGIPVGFILLFSFVVRVFAALFGKGGKKEIQEDTDDSVRESGFDRFLGQVNRLNIFVIGAIVFLAVFSFWVIPNLISFVGQTGLEIIDRYKWFFAGVGGSVIVLVAWIIYLRYLLAKKSIETEAEIRKYQLELGYYPDSNGEVLKLENKSGDQVVDAEVEEE
ncbi:MAG: hypothetical protein KJ737_21485 [Proteobacteria bacterium]|nr:hypothetical protein [Pseudomonadota bacterium]